MKWVVKIPHPTIPLLIREICEEEWLSCWIEPEYGYIWYVEHPDGKRKFFKNSIINLNLLASVEICKDKTYCSDLLKKFWFSVPEWEVFFSDEMNTKIQKKKTSIDAMRYSESIRFPLIIKPNDLSQWTWVMKVDNIDGLKEAIEKVTWLSHAYRIEEFCPGKDYRVVIFDGKVISAYERVHLSVIWDGTSSIRVLIEEKQKKFRDVWRSETIDIWDGRMLWKLYRYGYTLESVPKNGERVQLLDNANLSTGGESIDVTKIIHPDFQDIAIRSTQSLELRLCGVDIITRDLSRSLDENEYYYRILELNSSPGLDNYITTGEEQRRYVKELYKGIILER